MKKQTRWILFLAGLCACTQTERTPVRIRGMIRGVPDGMLYLAEARQWRTPLDSARVHKGRFTISIAADSSFYPYLATLYYRNGADSGRPVRLQYRNHTLPDSLTVLRDVFWLEPGTIHIEGNNRESPWLRIRAGEETELLYRHQFDDIGWMGDKDSIDRKEKMDRLKQLIQEHTASYYLLQSIYDSKELYQKKELVHLFGMFDRSLRYAAPGKQFAAYLALRPDAGTPYPNRMLSSDDGKLYPVIDTAARLNMLVFWASWCSPCIKEIPQLKELYREFSRRGLNMVSISIDEQPAAWRQALSLYEMRWRQLRVQKEKVMETEQLFNFTTIPFLLFTDHQGKELARFADYDPGNTAKYRAFILQHLN